MRGMEPIKLKLKYAANTFEINLGATEDAYARIAAELSLAPSRLKLIRAGKVLPPRGSDELSAALRQPGTLLVLSSDPLPSMSARYITSARDGARSAWDALTWEALRFYSVFAVTWLWSMVTSGGRAVIAFVSSAVVAPPPRREERRD